MARLAPRHDSKVRSISSGRHCVSTWMVTSSGIIFFSISSRTKSKSVSDAAGKPTSISLKPIWQSSLNIRVLRSESIGSISAWLPSRRSTAHQIGGLVMVLVGHCRSGSWMGLKATYFSPAVGIMGFWGDIGRLLAPRTPNGSWANTAMEAEKVAATGGGMRRTTEDPQSPGRGGGSANKSKRRQSQHGAVTIRPRPQESTVRVPPLRGGHAGEGAQGKGARE